jgi:integrase
MARTTNRLTDRQVRTRGTGLHPDGRGLLLQVTEGADGTLRRSWLYRFAANGRERRMGLGSLDDVSLAEARRRRDEAARLREFGVDPIEQRLAEKAKANIAAAKAMTFDECATAYIASHRAGWRNAKHAAQWASTIETYASPVFGKAPVQAVDVALVMRVLEPLWSVKPETASRVRGRIESILDWATVRGHRDGENPARWRGHLDHLLPARSKVRKVKHHAALPYGNMPVFMVALREREAVAARALEFAILTAARTGEVLGAKWSEIGLAAAVWTVPALRMKAGAEHRVPLSAPALAVLRTMEKSRDGDFVFPGDRHATLSNMSMLMLLRRMGHADLTAHGFRSTFRDWAAECTPFPNEVAEMALAHAIDDKTEAAYRRGGLFEKRRRLMDAWAEFCAKVHAKRGKVVPLWRDEIPSQEGESRS